MLTNSALLTVMITHGLALTMLLAALLPPVVPAQSPPALESA
jgi:hypothetical protein